MEIYLTFDDGIQAGTREVLSVLKETGVKATFFLVGKELDNEYVHNPAHLLDTLKCIFENHSIGNHSYSHADSLYSDYYANNGVIISGSGARRSVIDDFDMCNEKINHYLHLIYGKEYTGTNPVMAKNQIKAMARLPGKNTSYFSLDHDRAETGDTQKLYKKCEPNTSEFADKLYGQGYDVFGWTVEWNMSFDFHKDALAQKRINPEEAPYGHSIYLDMYDFKNARKDRIIEKWPDVLQRVFSYSSHGRAVLLMHDRSFRRFSVNEAAEGVIDPEFPIPNGMGELKLLITNLKERDVIFKTLDQMVG